METFLAEVAQLLRANHPDDLDQVTVVFNNRRSGLFLRKQFAAMDGKPYFLPNIIGIDELIAELGGLQIVPNEFLLFELYHIHCTIGGENRKFTTFEDFISFGDMMLADFSEIDLYCVDAEQLFSNLHELKAIGEWDVESGELTEFQKRYLEFYKSLYQYYDMLHQRLLSQGKAFGGMAYRHVAENIEALAPQGPQHKIYFVGFNALSTSENMIIRHYVHLGKGELVTDGDAYYFNDKNQEAGHFLRKLHQEGFPTNYEYQDHFANSHKQVTIVSCPEQVLQCKYAAQLLAEQVRNNPDNPIEQTAIVLADEALLLPTLNALPHEIKTANITMGYPFRNTAIYSLTTKLFSLHQRRRQDLFYHQDILETLTDIGICNILGIKDIHARLTHQLSQQHIIYATADEIETLCRKMRGDASAISFLFSATAPSPDEFLDMVAQLVKLLYSKKAFDKDPKEQESLACLWEILQHFQSLQDEYHFIDNLNVLNKIYTRMAQRRSVSFYGEPLKGLQILGVLETRNLDFKRVILISANEGTIPSGRTNNTLIPYNLKVSFGIPTFHDKDAVYAYNFYRLLQRADQIHLIYNTESDGMGKGAPSRFILQVRRELAPHYPNNIDLHEQVLSAPNAIYEPKTQLCYPKTEPILHRIKSIATKGFSPSALNKYRNCQLRYYYENVLSVKENDTVSEDLERNELGSYIHAVLEEIYSQGKGQPMSADTLQQSLDHIEELLNQVLEQQFHHGRSHLGRNHYLESVAKMQITKFLKTEIDQLRKGIPITIIGLEEELSQQISLTINGQTYQATIAGIADRIDQWKETIRIIDYKTGRVDAKELDVKEPEPEWGKVPDKWFQVMLYTWLYQVTHHTDTPHLAGIYPLGHLGAEFMPAYWEKEQFLTAAHHANFEQMLYQLVSDILDPNIPFTANFNPTKSPCKHCPFLETCQSQAPVIGNNEN